MMAVIILYPRQSYGLGTYGVVPESLLMNLSHLCGEIDLHHGETYLPG